MTKRKARIGSLFSGAGGLDLAVERATNGRTVWQVENDPHASVVLAARWPRVPNLGSVTEIDWHGVQPVDVLCGGFPCQDVSSAGKRAGMATGTRSGLWRSFAGAIDVLRPQLVVIENVRGLLSARAHSDLVAQSTGVDEADAVTLRAAGAVLGDLADLGFDADWNLVSASSIGAPHRRERVFVVAYPAGARRRWGPNPRAGGEPPYTFGRAAQGPERRGDERTPADSAGQRWPGHAQRDVSTSAGIEASLGLDPDRRAGTEIDLMPTPGCRDHKGATNPLDRPARPGGRVRRAGDGQLPDAVDGCVAVPSKYVAALQRWESLTRPAPCPTEPNTRGGRRINPAFSEWMMGLRSGWVTDPGLGLGRVAQLSVIGNGVVPQQAYAALTGLLRHE